MSKRKHHAKIARRAARALERYAAELAQGIATAPARRRAKRLERIMRAVDPEGADATLGNREPMPPHGTLHATRS